jgi:hypothetical protein
LALAAAFLSLLLIEFIINYADVSASLLAARSTKLLVSESEVERLFFLFSLSSFSYFSADLTSALVLRFLFLGVILPYTS